MPPYALPARKFCRVSATWGGVNGWCVHRGCSGGLFASSCLSAGGSGGRGRTCGLLVNSELLCLLSYPGSKGPPGGWCSGGPFRLGVQVGCLWGGMLGGVWGVVNGFGVGGLVVVAGGPVGLGGGFGGGGWVVHEEVAEGVEGVVGLVGVEVFLAVGVVLGVGEFVVEVGAVCGDGEGGEGGAVWLGELGLEVFVEAVPAVDSAVVGFADGDVVFLVGGGDVGAGAFSAPAGGVEAGPADGFGGAVGVAGVLGDVFGLGFGGVAGGVGFAVDDGLVGVGVSGGP